ncbi:MAG: hypothetical protein GX456_02960 [Verrucomicrobia bacterium]|nr:hypothetical protein [Verrucomicrobiota bacterium]
MRNTPKDGLETATARERGRPRPHQPDDRSYDPFRSRKSDDRTWTCWVRARMPALPQGVGNPNGFRSAAVLGRINPMTALTTRFDHANPTTEHRPAGCGQECPRSHRALETATTSGARPSSAASTRRPVVHLLQSR